MKIRTEIEKLVKSLSQCSVKNCDACDHFVEKLLNLFKSYVEGMEKEIFGFNERGIVEYSDGLAVTNYQNPSAVCLNCGEMKKGSKAKQWMFGHKKCKKPNGYYVRNDFNKKKWDELKKDFTNKLLRLFSEYVEGIIPNKKIEKEGYGYFGKDEIGQVHSWSSQKVTGFNLCIDQIKAELKKSIKN